jgi:hypothetical protein
VFNLACTGGIASCTFDTGAPLPDESQCQQDGRITACCEGKCVKLTEFCPDMDGDGFGKEDISSVHFQCANDPVPTGLTNCLDCCDTDIHAYPGSPWCDTVPPMGGTDGSTCAFDYNCDGLATPIACNLTDPNNHFVDVTQPFNCLSTASCDVANACAITCSGVSASPPAGAPDPCATACQWQGSNACGATSAEEAEACANVSNGTCEVVGVGGPGPIQSCN